eukprot:8498834-Prorocentrum_lima.AAC.1
MDEMESPESDTWSHMLAASCEKIFTMFAVPRPRPRRRHGCGPAGSRCFSASKSNSCLRLRLAGCGLPSMRAK